MVENACIKRYCSLGALVQTVALSCNPWHNRDTRTSNT